MNKQRYLAELQRLLVFMTDEDRELAIRRFGDIFDAAGPEGEAALAERLGSPTKSAIGLSRGYEPGIIKNLPEAPGEEEKKASLTRTVGDPWGDLPTFETPVLGDKSEAVPAPGADSVPEKENPISPEPEPPAPTQKDDEDMGEWDRPMPLGLGISLLTLILIAIGLPVAAVFLALMAVCTAPGAAVVFGAYLLAVGGLWCLTYIADALLLFGAAFLVLAVGLIVLWGGIWLCSRLVLGYAAAVRWLSGELLGKKVSDDE